MNRYRVGALLLCLLLTACSRHREATTSPASHVGYDQTALYDTPKSRTAFKVYAEEPTGPGASAEIQATDAAEYEEMRRSRERRRSATASSGGAIPAQRERPSAASPYSEPPKAQPQPGMTKDQGTSASDRATTQRIRRALLEDDFLSESAKSVQVVTRDGNILLRGQVMSERERWEVERTARGFAGKGKVDNHLTIQEQPGIR